MVISLEDLINQFGQVNDEIVDKIISKSKPKIKVFLTAQNDNTIQKRIRKLYRKR